MAGTKVSDPSDQQTMDALVSSSEEEKKRKESLFVLLSSPGHRVGRSLRLSMLITFDLKGEERRNDDQRSRKPFFYGDGKCRLNKNLLLDDRSAKGRKANSE